jgi:Mn2+/Fe2+ NRAMP family transporter
MTKKLSISGPGVLVAAAFIGPGTVTVCSIAGATYGFVLLWAVVLSIIATLVLQEMAARIGLVSQRGLAQVVREQTQNKFLKTISVILILAAIAIGNAAYEAGNISGGLLGLEAIGLPTKAHIGDFAINYWSIIIGALAAVILYVGNYKFIERFLVALVILMSLAFIITAIVTLPNILEVFKGMFVPSLPEGSLLIVVALVGTTVVPYNLFLHASLVKEKWQSVDHLDTVRRDTRVSIILGGLVSIAIIVCAAAIQGSEISTAGDLVETVQPLLGAYASYFIGIGLAAAGLTSAITAPLAVAYVVQGCLGWENNLKSASFRWVWAIILLIGVVIASLGYKPISIIKFAQIANGILLPVIAGYLLWIANKKNLLNQYVNTKIQNIIAIVIWLLAFGLGLWSILRVAGIIT